MRTLPRLKGISANLRKQLINSNDEQTIESMARYMPDNEILELTDQQLGYQPVVLGLLDREPLSVEIMTRMSRLPDGVGPLNLALRENLPLDIVMTLAKRDWDMIIQELYKDAWLLPESIIDGYIRSDDSSIRQVGAGGQLTYNQAMQLANDSSNNVVTSLAFKLAEMKHHGQLLRMTPQESDKVAGYLYQKFENDDDLIRVLFLALPDNLQFNFVKRMEKKSPAYFCCRDMQVIHSDAALQRLLTRFNDPEGWSNLAKNQYLSTSMKQKIWQRALSHRKNNPKADSDAYETSADMILSELISHGEVDDQMLLNATALIRSDDWDFLESALISWDNLPAVALKELQQNTPRNDIWAKFFLRQENSSRAQVDEALRVYYALDPDALAQLDVLAKQPDRIWWMTVFALSHAAWLLMLPTTNIQGGALLVLFLLALTESNDIAQYLWGKSCGRRKVVPKVSPGKTLEGLMGGVITIMIASLIIGPLLTPLNTLQALLAGLLIGISGFCGDVVMSAIKRDIGVKDSGKLLPGHGGLLDRIDSLIFTAPVFFYFIRYCCY